MQVFMSKSEYPNKKVDIVVQNLTGQYTKQIGVVIQHKTNTKKYKCSRNIIMAFRSNVG